MALRVFLLFALLAVPAAAQPLPPDLAGQVRAGNITRDEALLMLKVRTAPPPSPEALELARQRVAADRADEQDRKAEVDRNIAKANREMQFSLAASRKQVMVGMDENYVIKAWGSPHKINSTTSSKGTTQQWVFAYSKIIGTGKYAFETFVTTGYVYFNENGLVSSVQSVDTD